MHAYLEPETPSVQAVVACNATAQRICTLVLFISVLFSTATPNYTFGKANAFRTSLYLFLHNSTLKDT